MEKIIKNIADSIEVKQKIMSDKLICSKIKIIAMQCVQMYKNNGKLLVCGNGGSASDAQHMVGELVGRFKAEREGLAAVALNADSAIVTAVGNDYGYREIFSRQVKALGKEGDGIFLISTSGNSENIILAAREAKKIGLFTVGLTGAGGGNLAKYCDYIVPVSSCDTPRIQEAHILIIHIICELIEQGIYGER